MAKKSKKPVRVQDAGTAERPIFATDPEVQQDLQEEMSSRRGRRKVKNSRTSGARLSGGDLDAAVGEPGSGEETVGGSVPTPDQDIVENLGRAAGVTYQDDEKLNPVEKVKKRDRRRWELNPSSSEDYAERSGTTHKRKH